MFLYIPSAVKARMRSEAKKCVLPDIYFYYSLIEMSEYW